MLKHRSWAERKRCAWPADLNCFICRSRRRVGWCEFSALLFNPLCWRNGFHRIRHYGLLANANRADNIALARQLLGVPDPAPASADSDHADGGSRRRRAEYLSLLRRAYGHRRDFRTRLPAATVAQSSNRLRQFMTSTLLPPSHIAAPVPDRYLIADGHPPPTATVGAAFDRQSADRSLRDRRSDPAHGDQTQRRGDYSTVVPVRNRKIRACTGAKSP